VAARRNGKRPTEQPPGDPITFAYVHDYEVTHSFYESTMQLIGYDFAHGAHLIQGGWIAMRYGTDGLVQARNKTIEGFLESTVPWLFWIDTDMGFAPDTLDRLLAVADPEKRPIVGGLCFAQREFAPDGMGGFRTTPNATIFDWITTPTGEQGFRSRASYPVNTVLKCSGTGSACILIHRSVFERIAKEHGPVWYDRIPNETMKGQLISEDLSLCLRAGALNIPVHIHTGVRATHFKSFWLGESDYWQRAIAPPATEPVDVLVPVLNRPQNAQPFMQSLRASTGLASVHAIADAGDTETIAAWKAEGADVIVRVPLTLSGTSRPGTFAEKINLGYRMTQKEWLFICGDDVKFHAAWLDHVQAIAEERFHVIGTNDLANPRVMAGEHATHLLIRRSYVEKEGGGWDGPGVLTHEGYRHWFVDDEIVQAAKQRGAWAMALGSVVEHMHPLFGRAPDDETYRLGQSHAKKDKAHFTERLFLAKAVAKKEPAATPA
jgi:hypothetical protein